MEALAMLLLLPSSPCPLFLCCCCLPAACSCNKEEVSSRPLSLLFASSAACNQHDVMACGLLFLLLLVGWGRQEAGH